MINEESKYSEAQMLIRRPVVEVFESLLNPEITRNFWFTSGSGRLEEPKVLSWHWEMYGITTTVEVEQIVPYKKIRFNWGDPVRNVTSSFESLPAEFTYVTA